MTSDTARRATRRRFLTLSGALGAAAAWPLGAAAQPGDTVVLGQSVALTGPLAELGKAMHEGAKACFAAVNAKGGVNGRRIELVGKDDGYTVPRSLANIKAFL